MFQINKMLSIFTLGIYISSLVFTFIGVQNTVQAAENPVITSKQYAEDPQGGWLYAEKGRSPGGNNPTNPGGHRGHGYRHNFDTQGAEYGTFINTRCLDGIVVEMRSWSFSGN